MLNSIRTITKSITCIAIVGFMLSGQNAAKAQPNLVDYAYPVSGWVNVYGPEAQGSPWAVRKALSDFLDVVMDTVDLPSHPLLHPQLGPFISKFHHARWWEAINTLANVPLPTTGVRVVKLYSSSWIVQGRDGNDKFTFGVDVSDGPFGASIYTPNNIGVENSQISAMANMLDAYFVTHIHSDHLSARLIYEMLSRGKPVICSQEVKNEAVLLGAPNQNMLIVPTDTSTHTMGPLTWTSFQGWQFGAFLDAANTQPDLNHPFNVSNNAFLFSLNGKDIAHFGDNNDPGIINFLQTKLNEGWSPDLQMNLGQLQTTLEPMISPSLRFLSHDLEFRHFGPAFLSLQINAAGPSLMRRVLMWGEHVDLP